jgi:hypothetical protein
VAEHAHVVDARERLRAQRLQAALADDQQARRAVADLARVGRADRAALLQHLDPGDAARLASKRMPSSIVCSSSDAVPSARRTATGTISDSKAPALVAAIARSWLDSAYASSASFDRPYFFAIISPPMNWLNSGPGYFARIAGLM